MKITIYSQEGEMTRGLMGMDGWIVGWAMESGSLCLLLMSLKIAAICFRRNSQYALALNRMLTERKGKGKRERLESQKSKA